MNRHKREQKIMRVQLSDIKNYPGAVINDPDVFFGPVTVAELKRSVELVPYYQQQIRKRRAQEAVQACKSNKSAETSYENKENIVSNSTLTDNDTHHELNSTYELNNSGDCTMKETTKTERLLNSTFDKDNEDDNEICNAVEQTNDTVLNRTFDLIDVTENINLQIDETMNPEPKSASKRTDYRYRDNMQNTLLSECSQLEDETFTDAIKFDFQKDISIVNKTILTGLENLQLNSRSVLGEISFLDKLSSMSTKTKTINDIQPSENGSFPFSFCESDKENVSVEENYECKMSGDIDNHLLKFVQTPSKLSVTPFQDLTEAVLIDTSDADSEAESKRRTPGMSNAKAQKTPIVSRLVQKTPTSLKPKTPIVSRLDQKTPTSLKQNLHTKNVPKTPTSAKHQGTPTAYKNVRTPTTNSKIGMKTWEEKKPISAKKVVSSRIPRIRVQSTYPSPVAQYVKTGIPIPSMACKTRHSFCHSVEEKPSFLPRKSSASFKTPDNTKRTKIFQTPSKSPAVVGSYQHKKFFN